MIAPGLEALKKEAEKSGFGYKKGSRSESSEYNFKYTPHMVLIDGRGKELYSIGGNDLVKVYKGGKFVETFSSKVKELSGK